MTGVQGHRPDGDCCCGFCVRRARCRRAQDWPNRPVRVVVPFGAGGAADRLGRIAADHLSKAFKQQFYIENRVGAGGAVASKDIARADADGYTLLIGGSGPHIMGPAENPNIGYDPVGDFTHIAMIGGESFALSAQASLGVKSFKELIALSNSKPEPINCGTPGAGSLGQLMVEQMQLAQDRQSQSRALSRRRAAADGFLRQPHSGRGDADPADPAAGRGRRDRAAGGDLDRAHPGAEGRADIRRDRLSGNERRDLVLAGGPEGLAGADRREAQRRDPPPDRRAGDEADVREERAACRWTPIRRR